MPVSGSVTVISTVVTGQHKVKPGAIRRPHRFNLLHRVQHGERPKELAKYFDKVYATDISQSQLDQAEKAGDYGKVAEIRYGKITEAEKRAAALKLVNWERDKVWEGIAGKFTPKGVFSVGGAKETGYAIYSALADPSDPGYARIRSAVSGIAA